MHALGDVEVSKRRQFEVWALRRRDWKLGDSQELGGLRWSKLPSRTPAPTKDAPYGNTPCDKESLVS
jgi:hypothetical protein